MTNGLARVRRVYRRNAPSYDCNIGRADRLLGLDRGRRWACERARGDVLEVGIGTGLSLPHYGGDVHVTGIDATQEMLDIATQRAADLKLDIDLRLGDAEALRFDDASFDTVVFTYSLCTIPRPRRAVTEAHRVLRAGGTLLLTEHVRSPNVVVRGIQWLLDPPLRWLEADHLMREPLHDVRAAGFAIDELERSALGIMERLRATK